MDDEKEIPISSRPSLRPSAAHGPPSVLPLGSPYEKFFQFQSISCQYFQSSSATSM
jgi:hypothetical protein